MKYFGKSFFKFTLGFLTIILVSLIFMVAVSAYAQSASKVVFVTEEQVIKPGDISGGLTIQSQDSSGNQLQTSETLDLEFFSTSATGEFLSSTGNSATKTMNKNTANRTFYYRDSSEGSFTIKVVATGRDTLEVYSTEQKIIVSSSVSGVSGAGEVLSQSTEASTESSTSGASTATYTAQNSGLEVLSGGNRLTSPGSPITFQALVKKNTSSSGVISFSWSFGDGNVGEGALVSHAYKYPGEYAVVLNAKLGNNFSTNRFRVSVIKPEISILDKGDYIQISNNSKSEVNLFNWKIISEGRGFIFQPDTIILPNSNIMLDKSLLTIKGEVEEDLVLMNFSKQTVALGVSFKKEEEIKTMAITLGEAQKQVEFLAQSLRTTSVPKENNVATIYNPVTTVATDSVVTEDLTTREILSGEEESRPREVIYEAPKEEGVFSKIKGFFAEIF